MSIKTVN